MRLFSFTPQETRALIFLIAALVVGSGITLYKRAHPEFAPELILQKREILSSSQNNYPTDKGMDMQRIDINRADSEQLQLLPGIGPVIGKRIVDYRKANGDFTKLEDIMQVQGIGPKTFQRIKDYLKVDTIFVEGAR
jgi:comEA protein